MNEYLVCGESSLFINICDIVVADKNYITYWTKLWLGGINLFENLNTESNKGRVHQPNNKQWANRNTYVMNAEDVSLSI